MERDASQAQAKDDAITLKVPKSLMPALLEFDAKLRKASGISLLTAEGRVLFWLALNGPAPVSDALGISGASYGTFYTVVRRLKEANLISAEQDNADQRVRKLSVNQVLDHEILS